MVHAQAFHLVQRDQHSGKEQFVFFLERKRETIYDGAKDLQKLRNTIEPFSLICKLKEYIVDRSPDIGT